VGEGALALEGARRPGTVPQVLAVGTGQVLAFGSTMYLSAVIAAPLGRELGVTLPLFFAGYSVALGVMALIGPAIGRRIDRHGGRQVLVLSNLMLCAGLCALAAAQGVASLFAAWAFLGLGMGLGQYDAAFAALVHQHGRRAAPMIVGVTLIGGFASTVAWPLSAWWVEALGWRHCCLVWAGLHLVLGLPLHLRWLGGASAAGEMAAPGPPLARTADHEGTLALPPAPQAAEVQVERPAGDLRLVTTFAACTAFVTSAIAVHLPGLLLAAGSSPAQVLWAGVLLGPAQVAARLAEYGLAQRHGVHPLLTARVAAGLHPVACGVLGVLAALGGLTVAGAAFAVLHGAGAGMISVARGVLPLALFGPVGYGAVTGHIARMARAMQALAPFAYAVVLESAGVAAALAVSGGLSAVALLALLRLRR
jgi:MFS family permease